MRRVVGSFVAAVLAFAGVVVAQSYPGPQGNAATAVADSTVTSAKIVDGAIVDADVNASAAIAESKLALNFATHSNANDPSSGEKAALAGTSGTPGSGNKFVTDGDSRMTNERTPTAHNVLSTAHGDTTAATLVRGDLLVVDSTGTLVRLPKGAANAVVGMNSAGTDVAWISSTVGIQATLPSSISGLQLWVDAQDSAKYTLSGTDVLTITDKSSNANVFATSASGGFVRPVLTSNAINGHTAFLMGSSHQIASTGISGGSLNGFTLSHIGDAYAVISITTWGASRTVFALGTTVSASTNSGIVWRAQGSTQTGPSLFRRENGSDTETQNTGNFSSFPGASTGYLMRWTADRGGCTMGLNRAALPGATTTAAGWTAGTSATATIRGIVLGEYLLGGNVNDTTGYGQILTGYVGEVCLYNRRLADEERMSLEKYLATRWGTP
jgi:hypothetical protein